MSQVVFLVEEPSMKELISILWHRLRPSNTMPTIIVFEGKSDLQKRVAKKIEAFQCPNAVFVIVRDQDSGDCTNIKRDLISRCERTGKNFRVRIVCRELESWYLADLRAVEEGFNLQGLSRLQDREKFRNPDNLTNAKQELRYLCNSYQPIIGTRAIIAPHLDLQNQRSRSFALFVETLERI